MHCHTARNMTRKAFLKRKVVEDSPEGGGEWKTKEEILHQYKDQNQKDLINLIQCSFPLSEADGRKKKKISQALELIESMLLSSENLKRLKTTLKPNSIGKIEDVICALQKIVENNLK